MEVSHGLKPRAQSYSSANRRRVAIRLTAPFPWIAPKIKDAVPQGSIFYEEPLRPGELSTMEECDPEVWLGMSAARKVDILGEQILAQRDDWAMILLHAELNEEG